MTLPVSGPLTLTDIQGEFGGDNPVSLSEYYAGGDYVGAGTTGTYGAVPSSGRISIRDFYGTSRSTTTVNYVSVQAGGVFPTNVYLTSADGIIWTNRTFPFGTSWTWVARGNNIWVVFPSSGSTILYSTDAINWTTGSLPISATWSSAGFTNGRLVAIAYSASTPSTACIWSDDGINWNTSTAPSSYWVRTSGGSSGATGRYIGTTSGYGGGTVGVSPNGTSWITSTIPNGANINWTNAAYGNGVWMATNAYDLYGNGNTLNGRSTDNGVTWTNGGAYPWTASWYSIAYASGNFVAVAPYLSYSTQFAGSNYAAYSSDGSLNWNPVIMPSTQLWVGLTYAAPFKTLVCLGGAVGAYSTNGGVSWTQVSLPVSGYWNSIAGK
jgi:hypothetical protein